MGFNSGFKGLIPGAGSIADYPFVQCIWAVTQSSLLPVPFLSGSHERTPKRVFCSQECPNVVTITDNAQLLRNPFHIAYKHRTKRLYLDFLGDFFPWDY